MMDNILFDSHTLAIVGILLCNVLTLIRTRFVMVGAGLYRVMNKHVTGDKSIPNDYIYLMVFSMFSVLMCLFSPIVYFQIYSIFNNELLSIVYETSHMAVVLYIGVALSFINYIAMEMIGVRINCKIIALQHCYQMKVLERMGV